jgi:hypothetical protein
MSDPWCALVALPRWLERSDMTSCAHSAALLVLKPGARRLARPHRRRPAPRRRPP